MKEKKKIYIDADDTILNSSEIIIEILNNKYNITPVKTFYDLKDWKYKSIYNKIKREEIHDIYGSEEFINKVKIKNDFLKFYNEKKNLYELIIFTASSGNSLKNKEILFKNELPELKIIGSQENKFDLTELNGCQIDDNYTNFNFNNNKLTKILLKNYIDTDYNQPKGCEENFYIANDWNDISILLDYYF